MADTVEDRGNSLVVTRWRTQATIPLSMIRELRRERKLVGSEVTLFLNQPCTLGSEVHFLAPDKRKVPDIDETLDALASRINAISPNGVV